MITVYRSDWAKQVFISNTKNIKLKGGFIVICNNCGKEIYTINEPCKHCGHKNSNITIENVETTFPSYKEEVPHVENYGNIVAEAIVMIICIMLLPMANRGLVGAELLPNDRSISFFEVVEIASNGRSLLSFDAGIITVIMSVSAILLLIGGLCSKRGLCMFASVAGFVAMTIITLIYISKFDIEGILGFKDVYVGVGYWVSYVMLIIAMRMTSSKSK